MAAKKKAAKGAAKAGGAAMAAKNSPYVRRVIDDEDLRQNVIDSFEAARSAYLRLSNGKAPATKQIFDDKRLQKDLQSAASSFKDASVALREAPKKQRKGGPGKLLLLLIIGAAAALGLSEGLRTKLLDALFGAEEEFEYTSATTPPPTPSPTETTTTTTFTPAASDPVVTPTPGSIGQEPTPGGSTGTTAPGQGPTT